MLNSKYTHWKFLSQRVGPRAPGSLLHTLVCQVYGAGPGEQQAQWTSCCSCLQGTRLQFSNLFKDEAILCVRAYVHATECTWRSHLFFHLYAGSRDGTQAIRLHGSTLQIPAFPGELKKQTSPCCVLIGFCHLVMSTLNSCLFSCQLPPA